MKCEYAIDARLKDAKGIQLASRMADLDAMKRRVREMTVELWRLSKAIDDWQGGSLVFCHAIAALRDARDRLDAMRLAVFVTAAQKMKERHGWPEGDCRFMSCGTSARAGSQGRHPEG